MKQRIQSILILLAIIGISCVFRFTGIDWDQGNHLHPDERFILMKVEELNFQTDMNPHFFAYGSFPLYLLKIVGAVGEKIRPNSASYDQIYLLGRVLSGLFDIGTLLCIFYILHHITKNKYIIWLGTLWYGISVLPIQLSHFYAVDTILTFFSTLTIFLLLRYHHHPSVRYAIGIGLAVGFATATKVSAVVLAVPIGVTFLYQFKQNKRQTIHHVVLIGIAALYTFFICEPFAFFDFHSFINQLAEQQAMTKSAFTFPYTLQYVGKIPYIYEFKNIVLWGQGAFLGSMSILGILIATKKILQEKNIRFGILLSFFWIYTILVGKFAIGFMRYMLPAYPILTIFAALLMHKCTQDMTHKKSMWFYGISTGIILLWTVTFMAIYTTPNTRVTASKWIQTHIPANTTIALEHWDDALPLGFASDYQTKELPLYDPDTQEKWTRINQTLNDTDYIIIASNRLYTPLMKMTRCELLPQDKCFKTTAKYYQRLFAGTLGFTKVATFTDYPTIPFLHIPINDITADESFTVYDHPKIMIFKKTHAFTSISLEE